MISRWKLESGWSQEVGLPRPRGIRIDTRGFTVRRTFLSHFPRAKAKPKKHQMLGQFREKSIRGGVTPPSSCCEKKSLIESPCRVRGKAPRIDRIDAVQTPAFTWEVLVDSAWRAGSGDVDVLRSWDAWGLIRSHEVKGSACPDWSFRPCGSSRRVLRRK
jgi:hypothetical protein